MKISSGYLLLFTVWAVVGFETANAATIAVLPFTTEKLKKGENAGLRQFEEIYYSYCLVDALSQQGVQAYFSPAKTPATDLWVQGHIDESTGRETAFTLTWYYPDGKEAGNDDYDVSMSSSAAENIKKFDNSLKLKLWLEAAKDIAERAKSLRANETDARRVYGYANIKEGDPEIPVESHNRDVANFGASGEIEYFLKPMTAILDRDGTALTYNYYTWQTDTGQAMAERSDAKVKAFWGGVAMVMGAAANGVSSYYGQSNPASYGVVAQGAAMIDTSNNDIRGKNITLAAMHEQLASFNLGGTAVTMYNQVYHVTGSPITQLDEIHKIVQSKLGVVKSHSD